MLRHLPFLIESTFHILREKHILSPSRPSGIYPDLYAIAYKVGYKVEIKRSKDDLDYPDEYFTHMKTLGGYCNHDTKTIVLRPDDRYFALSEVLSHEIGHAAMGFNPNYNYDRNNLSYWGDEFKAELFGNLLRFKLNDCVVGKNITILRKGYSLKNIWKVWKVYAKLFSV